MNTWFDDTDSNNTVPAGEEGYFGPINILADKDLTLFVSCVNAFTFRIQYTDDTSADPYWFEHCDSTGALITFTCEGLDGVAHRKAIPLSMKAQRMRIIASNGGATEEAPYIGVM